MTHYYHANLDSLPRTSEQLLAQMVLLRPFRAICHKEIWFTGFGYVPLYETKEALPEHVLQSLGFVRYTEEIPEDCSV